MQKELKNLLKLSIAIVIVLLFFTLARLYFYFVNKTVFLANADFNLFDAFSHGFAYDFRFILAVNSVIVLMFFLPFRFRNTIFWQFIVKLSFTVLNSGLVLLYLIDSRFYNITGEHIKLFKLKDSDLYEQFISSLDVINFQFNESWDIIFVALFAFIVFWSIFPSINKMYFERSKSNMYFRFAISTLAIFSIWFVSNEAKDKSGDWQIKLFARMNSPTANLSVNSPYFITKFYNSEKISGKNHFDNNELNSLFPTSKNFFSRNKNKKNVLFINVSRQEINVTKFETLVKKLSTNYFSTNNFSTDWGNTAQQLDELLLSFPVFSKVPLIKTPYAFNEFESLVELLKQKGYFTLIASNNPDKEQYKAYHNFYGFDKRVLTKHNHKLLSSFENEINNKTENAFFALFHLDYGLNEILDYINDNKLNDNTLIIINLPAAEKGNDLQFGKTLYLMPDSIDKYFVAPKTQNVDIFPSIIDYLNLNKKFISFGRSVFYRTEKREVFKYTGKDYIIMEDSLLLRYNGHSTKWLIDYKNDPDEFFDLQDSLPVQKVRLENKIRAIIQKNEQMLILDKMQSKIEL